MAKRTVEMEDDLDERVDSVKEEIRNDFIDYLKDNLDIYDFDTYYQHSGADAVHEAADSNTPIHYKNIDDLYYLYGGELDEAYRNAGVGEGGKEENRKQVAIYYYLSEKGFDYLRELEERFDDIDDVNEESIKEFIKELESEK